MVAVPLKYLAGWPQTVSVMGPVHGRACLIYSAVVLEAASAGGRKKREIVRLVVACLLPFGPLFNEAWLRRKQAGSRKEETVHG